MLGPAPALRTPRLLLRPLTPADAPAVFAYAREPGFFRFLDEVPPAVRDRYEPRHAEEHVHELVGLAARGFPNWGILPVGSAAPVGAVRFRPAEEDGVPELGYGLASVWRGRGLATEAARAALAWAAPRSPAVVARCDPANEASLAVLRRLGFQPAGADRKGRLLFKLKSPGAP